MSSAEGNWTSQSHQNGRPLAFPIKQGQKRSANHDPNSEEPSPGKVSRLDRYLSKEEKTNLSWISEVACFTPFPRGEEGLAKSSEE
ncbi:hypothetical protein GJ744_010701 [Endocarpon pusillum]|uniref:Uncharacterized protein n=1 Tax=Endocarpon pusillum TaxID=364733 RepID=A0A8H7E1S2_9EURO|nr:hypothetical protein GJ744_010701 [Endocarpon pusillum]